MKCHGFERLRLFLVMGGALMLFALAGRAIGETKPTPIESELAAADQLLRAGKLAEAENGYQVLLGKDPTMVPAQVGLVRSMLWQQKLDESLARVNNALAANPKSAGLLAIK
jgi:predicted Zn-dependent protease